MSVACRPPTNNFAKSIFLNIIVPNSTSSEISNRTYTDEKLRRVLAHFSRLSMACDVVCGIAYWFQLDYHVVLDSPFADYPIESRPMDWLTPRQTESELLLVVERELRQSSPDSVFLSQLQFYWKIIFLVFFLKRNRTKSNGTYRKEKWLRLPALLLFCIFYNISVIRTGYKIRYLILKKMNR